MMGTLAWLVALGILIFVVFAVLHIHQETRPCVACSTGKMHRIRRSGQTVERGPHVIWTFDWRCRRCHARRRIDAFDKIVEEEGGIVCETYETFHSPEQ
jgi:hypothetical protein